MNRREFLFTAGAISTGFADKVKGQFLVKPPEVSITMSGSIADLSDIYNDVAKHYDLSHQNVILHIKSNARTGAASAVWDVDTNTVKWLQDTVNARAVHYTKIPVILHLFDNPYASMRVEAVSNGKKPSEFISMGVRFSPAFFKALRRDQIEALIDHEIDGHVASIAQGIDSQFTPLGRELYSDCKAAKVTSPDLVKSAIIAGEAYNNEVDKTVPKSQYIPPDPNHNSQRRLQALEDLKKNPSRGCPVR